MKSVLLTGASGYIGQFAIRHLINKNYTVHAVTSKLHDPEKKENLFWHRANLLDTGETKSLVEKVRPTHLLHFAWHIEHGRFWNAVENLDWLQAGLHLGRCFVKSGGNRMVIAGSCAEYDWTKQSPFVEYRTPFNPQTLYGAAKNSLSLTLERFAEVCDVSFASGKLFLPFGANNLETRLIPSVVLALLKNEPAKTTHGNQIRDFLFVEEVAEAFVALLDSDVRGAVNIASGKGVKIKEIVEKIGDIMGKPELLRIGALSAPENEPSEIVADVMRLHKEVGWNNNSILSIRLEETVNFWRERHKNPLWADNL